MRIKIDVEGEPLRLAAAVEFARNHVIVSRADLYKIKRWAKKRGVYAEVKALGVQMQEIECPGPMPAERDDGEATGKWAREQAERGKDLLRAASAAGLRLYKTHAGGYSVDCLGVLITISVWPGGGYRVRVRQNRSGKRRKWLTLGTWKTPEKAVEHAKEWAS